MKLSEKKQTDLYSAIADPVTSLRIKKLRANDGNRVDDQLFALESEIWKRVCKALNLDGPA